MVHDRLGVVGADHAAGHALVFPQVRTVRLAVRVARHSETGWDNAALPDDVDEVADLLNLSAPATLRLLQETDKRGELATGIGNWLRHHS